jgi:dTDP-4-amino-4,6-dideoxygalactose transaminase
LFAANGESVKGSIDDLAVFGAPPAVPEGVHVGRPNIGDRQKLFQRLEGILDRRWLTNNGEMVIEFERRIADFVGARHCVVFCNGTLALELLLDALQLEGEVILPSFTFVATAHAVVRERLIPVFCDIDPITHHLDPQAVERSITPRTAAILGVHLWGRGCDVDSLARIADAHRLPLLFDAAHAFGSSIDGRMIGTFGVAEVFSFHATKFVNSFEGGAVTTDDGALAQKLRLSRNFGFADYDTVIALGTNAKMSEISAAMGITSMESVNAYLAANAANHAAYEEALSSLEGIRFVTGGSASSNLQYVVIEIDPACGLTRDTLLEVLHAENVFARRYFYPGCHRMEPYRSMVGPPQPLVVTERVDDRVLALPSGASIGAGVIDTIADIVTLAVSNGVSITERLSRRAGTSIAAPRV